MTAPPGPDDMVVVIDAGPSFFRKPTWAYGPFASAADAEAWVAGSARRWQSALGGWEHRVVRRGTHGALRVVDPATLPPEGPDHR